MASVNLPRGDQRLLEAMANDAGVSDDVMAAQIVRAYLALVKEAPGALPNDPTHRAAARANKGAR